jgi:hypothetical protein
MAAPKDVTAATDYYAVTLSATPLANGVCRAILAGSSGLVNLTTEEGVVKVDFPLQAGYNPVRAKAINQSSTGPHASNVWALY